MGYYSEAALVFTAKGAETMRSMIDEQQQGMALRTRNFLEEANTHSIDSKSFAEFFHWDSVKWYQMFEEIACINSVMEELDDEDFLFIRIGEDFEDIEILGRYWENPFNLDVVRTVEFSLDTSTLSAGTEETAEKTTEAIAI